MEGLYKKKSNKIYNKLIQNRKKVNFYTLKKILGDNLQKEKQPGNKNSRAKALLKSKQKGKP